MSKSKRILITLPDESHDKAIKDSVDLFGKKNVSAFIQMLITKYKSNRNEKDSDK